MKRTPLFFLALFLSAVLLLLAALPAASRTAPASAAPDPQQTVQRAWELVKQSGAYSFEAQVDQIAVPLASPLNVGRVSKQQTARLEGKTDLVEHKMEFSLFAEGGSALDARSGTQIKIDGERAYSRQGQGAWQEIDDFSSAIAPQSDFMAFLAGATNIQLASPASESETAHYTFDVNGRGFAAYLEEQLTDQIAARGELPPGAVVDLSKQFGSLSGSGEIWIGADGLPVRQVLHVQFPPTSQEQIQADVTVSFRDFKPLPIVAAASLTPLERLHSAVGSQSFRELWLLGGSLGLLILGLILGMRRKQVYAAIICVLITAMVGGPLLQSVQASSYAQKQYAQAHEQEQQQQLEAVAQTVATTQTADISPNISPLEAALAVPPSAASLPGLASPLLLPRSQEGPDSIAAVTSTLDSDADGLTDDQELLLGTESTIGDTDGDSICDFTEVNGFTTGDGKTWYGDPLNFDTNRDSISDKREWGKDTNGDNTPDLWSFDNDGDGVPDQPDMSPFKFSTASFDEAHPLLMSFDHLTPNTPTYVEFQVRPVNPAHLRYAYDVLDWPKNDVMGQIMDADGKTFKDVNPESDSPQDDYGDVKLVPLLEIEIDGEPTNLPDEESLKAYGVSIQDLTSDGTRKALYVPLQVVSDVGKNTVAYYAKMLYLPASTWGSSHQVRMVWAVQALVDICAEDGIEEGICMEFETYNDPQIIQTYYDNFTLTGLNVREQHGTRWAVTYKDPAVISGIDKAAQINQLNPLSDLVFGLDHSFLAGRLGENGKRNFPVSEIHRRFDHTANAAVPVNPDRFGISENILLVNEYEFEHIDLAYMQISVTETKKILGNYTSSWTASQPITPTILFAHEEYYRPLNMDSMGSYSNITVSSDGRQYSLSLPSSVPAGSSLGAVEIFTATAVSWAPFIFQDGEWRDAPLDQYLEGMRSIYPPEMIDPDPAVAEGGLMFLEEYYANIYQGYFSVVEEGAEKLESPFEETDEAMTEFLETWDIVWEPIKIALECFFESQLAHFTLESVVQLKVFFSNLYNRVTGKAGDVIKFRGIFSYHAVPWGSMLTEGILALAWIITHIPPIHEKLDESTWGKLFIVSITAGFVGFGIYKAASGNHKHHNVFGEVNGSKSTEFGFWGMVIVTTLLVLAQIGIFIYMLVTGQDIDGVMVGLMVANLIASIIVVIIFAIISFIPYIGTLIVAIYNLINTILSEFLGINFTEMLIEALTEIFYDVDPMASLAPTVGETLFGFLHENGISVGNGVNISFPMDVVATQEDYQTSRQISVYNDVDYDLYGTRASIDVDGNKSAIDQNSDWHNKEYDHRFRGYDSSNTLYTQDMYRAHGNLTGQLDTISFTEAGLNKSFTYETEFDYKIHVYRCILRLFCSDKTHSGSVEEEDSTLYFDVLPASVDSFFDWNWSASLLHANYNPHDWDNDGLLSTVFHGSDPDDRNWDSDGDTLSDGWEIEMAATSPEDGGFAFNAVASDTDGDGLRDDQELRWGTDPALVDTDGDGRNDFDEVTGYNFTYASGKSTLVHSSPLAADTDRDGMDDKAEYMLHKLDPVLYPFNPNAWNTIPLSLQLQAGISGYLSPGATSPLTVTVQNSTDTPIKGTVTTQLPSGLVSSVPSQQAFEALGKSAFVRSSLIQSATSLPTSHLTITGTVCAALEMPLVYLPFDEASGSKTFFNQSTLGYYDATCTTQYGCPASVDAGYKSRGIAFSSNNQRLIFNQSATNLNFSGSHPFSLSVWVKPAASSRTDKFYIFGKTDMQADSTHGYNLYLYPNGSGGYWISFNNELMQFKYQKTLVPGTWYNLTAVSDGTTLKMYVDGIEAPGINTTNLIYLGPSSSALTLGAIMVQGNPVGMYYYNYLGSMDELYIYDRAVSSGEIASLSRPNTTRVSQPDSSCQLTASQPITLTVDADSPSASIISPANGTYHKGGGFLVIGGNAHDPTSFIRKVQVSVDGGAFQDAVGAESWAYTWDMRSLSSGGHTLLARAIDAVGRAGLSSQLYLKIDKDPPTISWTSPSWNPSYVRFFNMQDWYFPLSGSVHDGESGFASVEVMLDGGPDLPFGGWQSANLDYAARTWVLDYQFPLNVVDLDPVPNPSGSYTLSLRTTDNVGNSIIITEPIQGLMDNNPPDASLTNPISSTAVITTPITLGGLVSDTSTVSDMNVALVPVEQAEVVRDAALVMHLNGKSNSGQLSYMDASGFNQTGTSDVGHAPSAGFVTGKVDEAVQFSSALAYIKWREPLKTPFTSSLTAALWFKAKGAPLQNTTLLSLDHAAGLYWKTAGGLTFSVTDGSGLTFEASSNLTLADGSWHHVVGVWDGYTLSIYVDGVQAGFAKSVGMGPLDTSTSLLTLGNSTAGVNGFDGSVDEVMLFSRGFTRQEAANLYALGNRVWEAAAVSDPSAETSPWTYPLPDGLEGLYEIDLRGVDKWGNRDDKSASWTAWQGEIDMLAPRVSIQAVDTGVTTQVTCSSTDLNLSTTGYKCPCTTLQEDITTYAMVNDWYRTTIMDNTRMYRIQSSCSVHTSKKPYQLQACDIYGRCSTASITASSEPEASIVTRAPEASAPPEATPTPDSTAAELTAVPEVSATPDAIETPGLEATVEDQPTLELTETPGVQSTPPAPVSAEAPAAVDVPVELPAPALLEVSATPEIIETLEITVTPIVTATLFDSATPEPTAILDITLAPESKATSADPDSAEPPTETEVSMLPISALVDPVDRSVLTSFEPVDLTVRAEAFDGLKEILITLDGASLTSFTFPDNSVTGYLGATTWTPAPDLPDGAHVLLSAASDWAGHVQTELYTTTVYLDTLPPAVDVSPTVLTTTHRISNWGVELGGPVSDLAGIRDVLVALQDGSGLPGPIAGPLQSQSETWKPASVEGERWSFPWRLDGRPDGVTTPVLVQATDLGGHSVQAAREVTVDVVPPTAITMTVSYINSSGALTPVLPGQTIYDSPNSSLQITWTPASDGSGLRGYYAGLSQDDPPEPGDLTLVGPEGPLQVSQHTEEARMYYAYVAAEDAHGNLSWNKLGPFYVDSPLTPDLIAMPLNPDGSTPGSVYHGWMDSGESQIGFNRILSETVPLGLSLNSSQKFYLSWDAAALRIAWVGANWDSEGDMFVYLKTGSGGGTNQALNPYAATLGDTLTLPFSADTLVWVSDSQTARMLRWNGSAWADALPGGLPPETFRFTTNAPASLTDLYLPFSLLGIADPASTPLDVIAFGSQEQALRLWTVHPVINPHDSPILSRLLLMLPDQHNLVMRNAFHWDNLGLGQSPNRSRFLDVDVRGVLRANPRGIFSNSRWYGTYLAQLLQAGRSAQLVGDGRLVNYTIYYFNLGGAARPEGRLTLRITTTGSMVLPGGTPITKADGTQGYTQEIDLGPITPGSRGSADFQGIVSYNETQLQYELCRRQNPGSPDACQALHDLADSAGIEADLVATLTEESVFNHFTIEHPLVIDPPQDVRITSRQDEPSSGLQAARQVALSAVPARVAGRVEAAPPILLRGGLNTLEGSAYDPSGVSEVTVQVLDPNGDTADTSCSVDGPKSGRWSCEVSLPGSPDGTRYFARARAMNPFDYTSEWSFWRVLMIDAIPPTVTLDPDSESALTQDVLGPAQTTLSGGIQDNSMVKSVELCLSPIVYLKGRQLDRPTADLSCREVELNANSILTGTWSTSLPIPQGVDYASQTLSLFGLDAAGNRSDEPLERAFWFDTVPPSVTVSTQVSTIPLGAYTAQPTPILAGTAEDGSGQVELAVRMSSEAGGTQRIVIPVEAGAWSFMPEISKTGVYSLSIEARDPAGNLRTLGAWTLQVSTSYLYWMPAVFH